MKRKPMTMRTRISLTVSFIVFLSVSISSLILINRMTRAYEKELGSRVMAIAQTLAQSPIIREGLQQPEGWKTIQPNAERVRLATAVEYIVVFDMNKKRYSHPVQSRIGTLFSGGDEGPALAEQSYVSRAKGVNGVAIRAFVPVMDEEGSRQLGVVVVGVLLPSFLQILWNYHLDVYLSLLLGGIFAVAGAVWVSNQIKRQMFNMEPLDIAHLYQEREAVIESIEEGIIAIDQEERITVFNQQAARMMGVDHDVIGRPIREVIPDSHLPEVLRHGTPQYRQIRRIHDTVILSNRVPVLVNGKIAGAMSTFQDRTEVYRLAEELTGVKKYINAMRAQNHEYLNQLHTIAGLIQLGRYDEVIERILHFHQEKEEQTYFLTQRMEVPSISGLILGKVSHARERGVKLEIHPCSSLPLLPPNVKEGDVLIILGNLLENAIEAASRNGRAEKRVELFIEGNEDGIEIQVTDNGTGIPAEVQAHMFEYGYTTKESEGHGIGLFLVKQIVELYGGSLEVESVPGESTRFLVVLYGPAWEE